MPRQRKRSSGKVRKNIRPCTYGLGYVRQDLYACRKCTADANGRLFAFCAGCRQTCHADCIDHVFELYTKRHFKCDCGNKRARNTCVLQPDKDDINVGNERTYSHNFEGKYCRCDREYDETKPMAQCAMCEDWFHEECYKSDSRTRGNGETYPFSHIDYELTCKDCVKTLPVLFDYYQSLNAWAKPNDMKFWKSQRLKKGCVKPEKTVNSAIKPGSLDLMWKPGFRINLCKCVDCLQMYSNAGAKYIADKTDFMNVVEEDISDVFDDKPDEQIVDEQEEEIEEVEQGDIFTDESDEGKGLNNTNDKLSRLTGNQQTKEKRRKSNNAADENDDYMEVEMDDDDADYADSILRTKEKSMFDDGNRIPRKPHPNNSNNNNNNNNIDDGTSNGDLVGEARLSAALCPEDVTSIRERIFKFLSENIDKNGGRLNHDDVLMYISDLKKDFIASYQQKLDETYGSTI